MFTKLFKSKKVIQLTIEKEMLQKEIEKLKNQVRKQNGFLKCKNNILLEEDEKRRELHEIKENNKIYFNLNSQNNYLIPIEKYLSEVRLKKIVSMLKSIDIEYVQELDINLINNLNLEDKIKSILKNKIEKFDKLEIDWETKTYLFKGEKIKKIYSKHRKFKNKILNENLEFMSDLEKYNFENLSNDGYLLEEIENIKKTYKSYMKKHKINKKIL